MQNEKNSSIGSIVLFGAGSIGCYIGGRLAAAGGDITLIGRDRMAGTLQQHGLKITDLHGADIQVSPEQFQFSSQPDAIANACLVLVCVKSAATREVAKTLAQRLPPQAIVISMQNGLANTDVLRNELPNHIVLNGIVEFNVVNRGDGAFHQGSEGSLEAEDNPALAAFQPLFEAAGLPLVTHADILPVQWAKLLLNLNNPINALSNVPLKEELSQRDFRRCVALAQSEALNLLEKAGIKPTRLTPLPAHWIPKVLGVPDWLFKLLGNKMLAIDPLARSSMWEDLEAGRTTEIEWINGEVVRLAEHLGLNAPVNKRLITLIREAETSKRRRNWSGVELLTELKNAQNSN